MQPESLLSPLVVQSLSESGRNYHLRPPRLTPALGAAVLAARLSRRVMTEDALERLQRTDIAAGPQ